MNHVDLTPSWQSEYSEMLDDMLPRLELSLSSGLDNLLSILHGSKDFYVRHHDKIETLLEAQGGATFYAALPSDPEWIAQLKAQMLVSDRVVVQDPLAFVLNEFEVYSNDNQRIGFTLDALEKNLVREISNAIEQCYAIKPGIEHGYILPFPIFSARDYNEDESWTPDDVRNEDGFRIIDVLPESYLKDYLFLIKHLKVLSIESSRPPIAHITLPVINLSIKTVVSRPKVCSLENLEWRLGLSLKEWIALKWLKRFHISLRSIKSVGALAEVSGGGVWTPERDYWNAINYYLDMSDNPISRTSELANHLVTPDVRYLDVSQITSIKLNEPYIDDFQKELVVAVNFIGACPGDDKFVQEADRIFRDIITPGISRVDELIEQSKSLSEIPKALLATGISFSSVYLSGGTIFASALAATATGLGFSNLIDIVARPHAKAREHPYYMFWKLKNRS